MPRRRDALRGIAASVFVVVPSRANPRSVREFGVVGDGVTNDGRALAQALSSGVDVHIPAGVYKLDDHVLRPMSGARITGERGKTVLTKRLEGPNSYLQPLIELTDVQDLTIDGLTLASTPIKSREYGLLFRATTQGQTKQIHIRNCIFKNVPNFIEQRVESIVFDSNTFLGGGKHGAMGGIGVGGYIDQAGGGRTGDHVAKDITIRRNLFEEIRDEGVDLNWNVHNAIIEENRFINCDAAMRNNEAIDIGGGDCRNIAVRRNLIRFDRKDVPARGIWVKNSTSVEISNNTLVNASNAGIGILVSRSQKVTLQSNVVTGFAVATKR